MNDGKAEQNGGNESNNAIRTEANNKAQDFPSDDTNNKQVKNINSSDAFLPTKQRCRYFLLKLFLHFQNDYCRKYQQVDIFSASFRLNLKSHQTGHTVFLLCQG
ncbi:hypothetical protein ACO0LB_14965 [Undibacterium sp. SXout7W]|uniref:hypothetical protein n=1 Tax=Undibacterium sp. SXout7W TaxID=3413049 RepID=UPI003BF3868A